MYRVNFLQKKTIIIVSNGASFKNYLNPVLSNKNNNIIFETDCFNTVLYSKTLISELDTRDQFLYKKKYLD